MERAGQAGEFGLPHQEQSFSLSAPPYSSIQYTSSRDAAPLHPYFQYYDQHQGCYIYVPALSTDPRPHYFSYRDPQQVSGLPQDQHLFAIQPLPGYGQAPYVQETGGHLADHFGRMSIVANNEAPSTGQFASPFLYHADGVYPSQPHYGHDMDSTGQSQSVHQAIASLTQGEGSEESTAHEGEHSQDVSGPSERTRGDNERAERRQRNTANNFLETVERLRTLLKERFPDPNNLTPQELANQVLRILARNELRHTVRTDVVNVVESSLRQESRPAFRAYFTHLWTIFDALRSMQGQHAGYVDETLPSPRLLGEQDAERAIAALAEDHNLEQLFKMREIKNWMSKADFKKTLCGIAFRRYLLTKELYIGAVGNKKLNEKAREFGKTIYIPGFRSRGELLRSLVEYLREAKPSISENYLERLTSFAKILDSNRVEDNAGVLNSAGPSRSPHGR